MVFCVVIVIYYNKKKITTFFVVILMCYVLSSMSVNISSSFNRPFLLLKKIFHNGS